MPKKSLILVTWGFPFGETEQSFLRTEFDQLSQAYQITILTFMGTPSEPILYPIPENVRVEQYSYRKNGGMGLIGALPNLVRILVKPWFLQELWSACKGYNFGLKKARLRKILSFGLRAEQLKRILEPLIEQTNAEIVYTYWCYPITLTAIGLKKKYPKLKVLTRFHGYDLYNERLETGWQPCRNAISKGCDRLVFACDAARSHYLEHWGRQWAEKSVVSYLGCRQMGRVSPALSDTLVLVSCSAMIPLKRISYIIDALALLPESAKVEWHHIGDGVEKQALSLRAAEKFSTHSNIRWKFWGHIFNTELPAVYQEIKPDVFITTTSTEGGVPVSIQEAFSMGIPAIATAVGGIPELVRNEVTGILLPENVAVEEITASIRSFYEMAPSKKKAIREAAFALWETQFDAKKNAENMVRLLNQL